MAAPFLAAWVLACGPSAIVQAPPAVQESVTQIQIDAAIDRGVAFLRSSLGEKTGEPSRKTHWEVGGSALALYTLLKCGVDQSDPMVRELLAHLAFHPSRGTYNAACVLMALVAHDSVGHRPWIDEVAKDLASWQCPGGEWSYGFSAREGDLSNTQYAALGLAAAARAGVEVPSAVWEQLTRAVLRFESDRGGFAYVAGISAATGSMTAAAVGTLAICELRLRTQSALTPKLERDLAGGRERGLAWLAKNFSVTENPGHGGWLTYYLYGLERIGAFAGVAQIGGHDWYREGAGVLVRTQREDGTWPSGNPVYEGCFALLFLRRASASDRRAAETGVVESVPADVLFKIAADGDAPLSMRISYWNRKALKALEWPNERGHGPRVARVEYLADGEPIEVVLADATHAAAGAGFAATHVFARGGKHRLKARVWVRPPPGERGAKAPAEQVLESPEIEVAIERALPLWLTQASAEAALKPVERFDAKARASSYARGRDAPLGLDYGPALAIDRNPQTAWLAEPGDEQRTLHLSFAKPVRCNAIQVRAALLPFAEPSAIGAPLEIEIAIDGAKPLKLMMSPDRARPIQLELERAESIQRLELCIRSMIGDGAKTFVGIGEVELLTAAK